MLHAMEQIARSSPSSAASSFASLLASLTPTAKEDVDHAIAWGDGDLGDDVVTLSYDRALRNHARYRSSDDCDRRSPLNASNTEKSTERTAAADKNAAGLGVQAGITPRSATGHDLRTSSVTIRFSDAECARLRQRATEAGMTVSAYLRSCVLEADALRAQVKEALAEMKTAAGVKGTVASTQRQRTGWLRRITKRTR